MVARGLTILVAVPIIAVCIYFGGAAFLALVLALALFSLNEFYSLMQKKGFQPAYWIGNVATIFFLIVAFLALKKNWEPAHSAIFTVAVIVALGLTVFLRRPKKVIEDVAVTILGMIYIGWFFSYLIFIRALTEHGAFLFFLMITIWSNDIVAYLVGKSMGSHKLNPEISPKKTIEGSVAGFIVCVLAAGVFANFIQMDLAHALILGAIIGIVAQVSDLVESLIKREAGAKDSSQMVPGHGGVLDRMDSFILTAPLMYYYIVWIGLG